MNLLREEYCKEINTPMGLDDVYDYVKWLEKKLTETNQALQLIQPDVIKSVCLNCDKPIEQHSPYTRMCPDKFSHYEQTVL